MTSDVVTDSTLPVEGAPEEPAEPGARAVQWLFPPAAVATSKLGAGTSIVVGRDASCDVVGGGGEASRRHAEIGQREGALVVTDLKSLNGTFVNGKRVMQARLESGDVLRIGELIGVVAVVCGADTVPTARAVAQGFWAGPTLRTTLAPARKLASTSLPVLLQGDTGSGKERVARAIHEWSGRSGPFVAVNCAAIPEDLAEAELFGYRKGAFTGADQSALGHFRAAHRGTLLLDEVAELSPSVQAKLLRVIEQNEVHQLGDSRATPIDVRIIAASLAPLPKRVDEGGFRVDLYARLNGLTVIVPGLGSRKDELPSLFLHLLENRSGGEPPGVEALLIERLLLYSWPGNVRELDLIVRRLLGLHGHEGRLRATHLAGTSLDEPSAHVGVDTLDDGLTRDERDFRALVDGLRENNGNLTKAASKAKISRQRAYRLVHERGGVDLDAIRKNGVD